MEKHIGIVIERTLIEFEKINPIFLFGFRKVRVDELNKIMKDKPGLPNHLFFPFLLVISFG